jgi:hypothetical protein
MKCPDSLPLRAGGVQGELPDGGENKQRSGKSVVDCWVWYYGTNHTTAARSSPQLQLGPTLICSPQKVPTQSGFSHYGNSHLTTMSPNHGDTDEGEEDDYMSMVIEEPKFKETFTQRKRREQREVSTERE